MKELGLVPGIHFETSLIDAHAGGVGVMESMPHLDSEAKECVMEAICHHVVLVCGTSTCHMAISRSKLFIPGVWGPFWLPYNCSTREQVCAFGCCHSRISVQFLQGSFKV